MKKNPYKEDCQIIGVFLLALSIMVFIIAYVRGWLPSPIQEVIKYVIH